MSSRNTYSDINTFQTPSLPFGEVRDIIGGGTCLALHQAKHIIVYEAGCSLIMWDLLSDKKIKLHSHPSKIEALTFLSHDDRLICSINGGKNPSMCITEWETLRRVQEFQLPFKQRSSPVASIKVSYSYQNNILGVVENEQGGGYRLCFWEIRNNAIDLLFLNDVEHSASCINFLFFESITGSLNFAISEPSCIKYWSFEEGQASLKNKIYVKSTCLAASISKLTSLLCFVDVLGKAVFINSEGSLVTQFSHPSESFTSVHLDDIYAYFGCSSGALCIYHLNSFRLQAVYPFLGTLKAKHLLKNQQGNDNRTGSSAPEGRKVGPGIRQVVKSGMSSLLSWRHSDGMLVIFDCEAKRVVEYQIAHGGGVQAVEWLKDQDAFLTVGQDGFLMKWELVNDKWLPKILDVSNRVSLEMPSNFYHNKNGGPLKSETDVINSRERSSLKAMAVQCQRNELVMGDGMGNIYIFDLDSFQLVKKVALARTGIEALDLSPKGSLLGVVLSSGEAILCDCARGYQKVQNLESGFDDYSLKTSTLYKSIKLIQDELERSSLYENLAQGSTTRNRTSEAVSYGKGLGYQKAVKNYKKFYVKTEVALKVITVHNSNTLHLQQIYKDDLTISRSVKIRYCVEGKTEGFAVHPSNDYLLVLSNLGYVDVFKLINGDKRLRISVPLHSKNLFVDPSGLYLGVSCRGLDLGPSSGGRFKQPGNLMPRELDYMLAGPPSKELINVALFEIGTGEQTGALENIFDVGCSQFSSKGDYIMVGGSGGHVGVWAVQDTIFENVEEVLSQMKVNQRFWNDYPIMPPGVTILDAEELRGEEGQPDADIDMDDESYDQQQELMKAHEEGLEGKIRFGQREIPFRKQGQGGADLRTNSVSMSEYGQTANKLGGGVGGAGNRPKRKQMAQGRFYEEKMAAQARPGTYQQYQQYQQQQTKSRNDPSHYQNRFLRQQNAVAFQEPPSRDPVMLSYKSRSRNGAGGRAKYTISNDILNRRKLEKLKQKQADEINKRLKILQNQKREKEQLQVQNSKDQEEAHLHQNVHQVDSTGPERIIYRDPSDIDMDYDQMALDDLSENQSIQPHPQEPTHALYKRNGDPGRVAASNLYKDIANFESHIPTFKAQVTKQYGKQDSLFKLLQLLLLLLLLVSATRI